MVRFLFTLILVGVYHYASADVACFCSNPGSFTNSFSSSTSTTLTVSWSASTGAISYDVYYKVSTSGSYSLATNTTGTSVTLTSLTAGQTYNVFIRAIRICYTNNDPMQGVCDTRTADSNVITSSTSAPATPGGLFNSSIGQTTFTANWSGVAGVVDYTVEAYSGAILIYSGNTTGTSLAVIDPDLTAGNTFSWRVRANGANGSQSAFSSGLSILLVPGNPTGVGSGSNTSTSFSISWSSTTGSTGYRLDVSVSNSFSPLLSGYNDLSVTSTSQVVNGLTAGTTYFFRVRAQNSSGTSGNSITASTVTVSSAPVLQAASGISQTSFTAQWNSSLGATSYRIDVSNDNFSSLLSGYSNLSVSSTSQLITGLSSGETYQYRVRALNSGGVSINSSTGTALTKPAAPTTISFSSVTQSEFSVSWNTVTSASQYRLDISADNFATYILSDGPVVSTLYTASGLQAGKTYQVRVRALNSSGLSTNSSTSSIVLAPANPVGVAASSVTTSSFIANWQTVETATGYQLDVSSDGFVTFLDGYNNLSVSGLSRVLSGLTENKSYQYRIRAVNASGVSGNSNTVTVSLIPTNPTTISATSITEQSFIANWNSVAGASSYQLDVSTDNFTTLLPEFNNLSVSATNKAVTGLASGTSYHYRVRALNSSGASANSNTTSVLLISSAPLVKPATAITQNSFQVSWDAVVGTTGYQVDVSEDDFTTMVVGYQNLSVAGTNQVVSGLKSGTTFKIRARSVNASGISGQSAIQSALTISATPVQPTATGVSTSFMNLQWESIKGADSYLLDVATNQTFTNFIPDFQNRSVSGTSAAVNGLSPGLTYYIRLRSVNVSGRSDFSPTLEQVTVPAAPLNLVAADRTVNQFILSWAMVTGATGFELEVALDQNFQQLVTGFNPKVLGAVTEQLIAGLSPATNYYVRLKSKNAAGYSEYSSVKIVTTLSPDGGGGDPQSLKLQTPTFPAVWQNTNDKIAVGVSGTSANKKLKLFHRAITQNSFLEETISVTGVSGQFSIISNWLDELGMEFYLELSDEKEVVTSEHYFVRSGVAQSTLSINAFGGELKDYRIISMPYVVDAPSIENFIEPLIGAYDPGQWRMVRYQNGKNVDYTQGLSKTKFERGVGYWFNSVAKAELSLSGVSVAENHQSKPFVLNLLKGWNQIGNPFPFTVDWKKVQSHNVSVPVSNLLIYDADNLSLIEGSDLLVFSGGFVWSDQDVTITIPVTARKVSNGGGRSDTSIHSDGWHVSLSIEQDKLINKLGGIGMSAMSNEGKDQLDLPVVPYLNRYAELRENTIRDGVSLTRNIVNNRSSYTWHFEADFNGQGAVTLRWNPSSIPNGTLILEDLKEHILVDMKAIGSYTFEGAQREIRIHYRSEELIMEKPTVMIGVAYPNPTSTHVAIPAFFDGHDKSGEGSIDILSVTGEVVYHAELTSALPGIHQFIWNLKDKQDLSVSPGLYYYKLRIAGDQVYSGRFIVNQN